MNFNEISEIVIDVDCQPYVLRFACAQCQRDWESLLCRSPVGAQTSHSWYLQARLWRPDTHTGEMGWGGGGKYQISPHSTRDEIVKRALTACLAYAEHEVREAFLYKGRRIFGPHLSVEALWEVADQVEERA